MLELDIENYGLERYSVGEVRYNVYPIEMDLEDDEGNPVAQRYEFIVLGQVAQAILRVPALEEVLPKPRASFELAAVLDAANVSNGQVIVQAEGWDSERNENLTNFYYFQHHSVEDLVVKVLEELPEGLRLHITGRTVISNYGKGSPDATVTIETIAKQDANLERSFS